MPLTGIMNKHMLPVGKYPMIHYAVQKMSEAGITDLIIVTGRSAAGDFIKYLGGGSDFNVSITYRIQEQAGGIAQALELARPMFQPREKFIVLLGDNLFEDPIEGYVKQFEAQPSGAMVVVKEVPDPHRYGVPVFDETMTRIERIEEKPLHPKTNMCVTGLYFYDTFVFEHIDGIQPSARGELEITDINNAYASSGQLSYAKMTGWWDDAGTFDSLYEAAKRIRLIRDEW
jgi:glucose-1-phosphate thymidylyltransferase